MTRGEKVFLVTGFALFAGVLGFSLHNYYQGNFSYQRLYRQDLDYRSSNFPYFEAELRGEQRFWQYDYPRVEVSYNEMESFKAQRSNLAGSVFYFNRGRELAFEESDLSGSTFFLNEFDRVSFRGSNLKDAIFYFNRFKNCSADAASLEGATFLFALDNECAFKESHDSP